MLSSASQISQTSAPLYCKTSLFYVVMIFITSTTLISFYSCILKERTELQWSLFGICKFYQELEVNTNCTGVKYVCTVWRFVFYFSIFLKHVRVLLQGFREDDRRGTPHGRRKKRKHQITADFIHIQRWYHPGGWTEVTVAVNWCYINLI